MAEIGYGVVIAGKLPDDTSISFQINFEVGTSTDAMNAEFDKLFSTIERRQARLACESIRQQIESMERSAKDQEDQIIVLKSAIDTVNTDRSSVRPGSNGEAQAKLNYNNAITTLQKHREKIAFAKSELAKMEQKAA